ncbi:MAG: hypothetical protein U0893_06810 [Chloroflexota bacterium]
MFAVTRSALLGLLPLLFLVGFTGAVFFTELTGGPLFFGRDTTTFYYPLTRWAADEIWAGRLPLWTPTMFGGYSLFADGEVGLLSPFQAVLLWALQMPLAYSAARAVSYVVASLGLYLYARTLGAHALGASIGALAFGYSSFTIGHLQHDNIVRSASWLPWLLLATEHALRTDGPRRLLWIAVAALALAFAGVGVHIQPVLMSLLVFGLALLFGPFGRTSIPTIQAPGVSAAAALGRLVYDLKRLLARRPTRGGALDWLTGRVTIGLAVVGLGLGMAAVQLVPLYQLGLRSIRANLVTYDYATSFAVSPPQVLTLLFPSMFNFDTERSWALWAPHETTLYVGVAPLLLATIALAFVRGRAVAFFGLLALVSLVLVFGDYLPIKPYAVIWGLPGFSYLRAPARFSLVLSLALAILAALGTTWLARRARYRGSSRPLLALLNAMLLAPLVFGLTLGGIRWWLRFDPVRATDLFTRLLQTSRENPQLGAWHVYYGLSEMTRPDNPRTALGLALLAAVPLVVRLWLARPRTAALCGALLLSLTAGDLWFFATSFYPQANADDLSPRTPAVAYLSAQPQPFRVFVEPALNPRYGANQLAGLDIQTVNGYSSLEPPRFSEYWWSIVHQDNVLLDLFDVRYVLGARLPTDTRTFEGTAYHPYDLLMSGSAANPSGQETFRVQPPTRVTSVVLVGAVQSLGEAPTGTTVAEITLVGGDGSRQTVPVRAGLEVSEQKASEPGWPLADYVGPRVVWAGPTFSPYPAIPGEPFRLYGSTVPLAQPFDAVAVEVKTTTPVGRLNLHGLGLRGADNVTVSIRPLDKAKYRLLAQDATTVLMENTTARPRVSIVDGVVAASGPITADQLLELAWDPSHQAVVEGLPAQDVRPGSGTGPVGEARLLSYTPTEVVAQAEMTAPGYLLLADRYDDGWHAYLDDAEVRMARANSIERLVAVPAGSHVVRFSYQPYALGLGVGVSIVAVLGWLGLIVVALARAAGITRFPIRLPGRPARSSRSA